MKWNIVMDSSCDTDVYEHESDIRYETVPFVINVDGTDYVDTPDLDLADLIDRMAESKTANRTSCPSPNCWYEQFMREGNVFAVTISRELSGSYNSAVSAMNMVHEEDPDKKIAIFNTRGTGPTAIILIRRLSRWIDEGYSFEEIVAKAEDFIGNIKIIFALSSFDNLVKNGRMSRIAGFVANRLGFWGIGIGTDEGKIHIKAKVRGTRKVVETMIQDMLERRVPIEQVVISHCFNPEVAESIRKAVQEKWAQIKVDIYPTKGLDSFYAEKNGLIVSWH
ncbi:MAG: DegV family protein [Solobacterium sp.]|nr:DegV family protein [Solobacterium sp.]